MARSSGGGSRSGGSRRSSSLRRSGSGRIYRRRGYRPSNGIIESDNPFPGARKFRYYRDGERKYIYSNTDLTKRKDPKPRWFLIFFYIPFIFGLIQAVKDNPIVLDVVAPLSSNSSYSEVLIDDRQEILSENDKEQVMSVMRRFKGVTGVNIQLWTIPPMDWEHNGAFRNYVLPAYSRAFDDETGWLIAYSETNGGVGEWYWEGVEGDDTIAVLGVFIDQFNDSFHQGLLADEDADLPGAFVDALELAIDTFEHQEKKIDKQSLLWFSVTGGFLLIHASILIFAGTKKKFSYSELVEERDSGLENLCFK